MMLKVWVSGFIVAALVCSGLPSQSFAETVPDREGAVRKDRDVMEDDPRWIYNDIDRGFAEAKSSGKPLLVVLRCVPCLGCIGLDASLLISRDLAPLLDRFVCVRVINANTLDLSRFQFDFDLSFSTLFFNGDGTLYGRFGSWMHQKDPKETGLDGYKATLAAVLALHQGYPANRDSLAGKQAGPSPVPFNLPIEIPTLAGKYQRELDWEGKVVQSCVHCHQVGDAIRAYHRNRGEVIPSAWIFPMPAPETVGLGLAPDQVARVRTVEAGSPAAQAGFRPGDDLLAANGQPLVSIADLAWALHRSPESGELRLLTRRSGAEKELTVALEPGWRERSDISRRVGTWPMRAMATGGLILEELPENERSRKGLAAEELGLRVKGVGKYGPHGAARQAGFQEDDILVKVEGLSGRMTEGQLIGRLLQAHPKREKVPVIVLRGKERLELMLPMQ